MSQALVPTAMRLRPATAEDGFMIRRWLKDPASQACWGNRASAEAEITLARISQTALCRIVVCEGTPIGYAQAIETGLGAGARAPELLPGTWDTQFWIAPPRQRGRAVLAAIPALLAQEVFATTLAIACSGLVLIKQEMMVRAYEAAGFRWRRICHDPVFGPAWLLLKERPR